MLSKVYIIVGEVAAGKQSAIRLCCLSVARESWVITGIFWSELGTWAPTFPDNPLLNVSSHHSHTDTVAYRPVHAVSSEHAPQRDRQMDALQSSSMAWTSSKVPKSATSMLRRWECTSWKQWSGLICGFERDFDRSPCSQQKHLWPLVKNFLSLLAPNLFHSWSFSECGRSGWPEVLCL